MLTNPISIACFAANTLLIKHCSVTRHIDPWLTLSFRFAVGLLVSGVVYVLLTRSLDVSHELELIESHPELADPSTSGDVAATVLEEEN